MYSHSLRSLLLGLVLGVTGALVAGTAAAESLRCDPTTCTVMIQYTPEGGQTVTLMPEVGVDEDGLGQLSDYSMDLGDGAEVKIMNLTMNPDPGIIFAVSATTGAAPAVFAFGFSIPIALSGTIDAASSIGYTLTDGSVAGLGGTAGVTIAPFSGPNILVANDFDAAFAQTNKGVDNGPAASGGAGTCSAFVIGTSICGPYGAMNTFSGGPFVLMGATLSFVLSARDSAGLSGLVVQELSVPEPLALILLGSALGLVALRRR